MTSYKTKTKYVDAIQYTGEFENFCKINGYLVGNAFEQIEDGKPYLMMHTADGDIRANLGDYIIINRSKVYVYDPVYFESKYEKHNNMEKENIKPNGIQLIAEERNRQITEEGWTLEHDRQWKHGELAEAAACYAAWLDRPSTDIEAVWPFDMSWWKPSEDRIRELQKAGALIAAEIDRLLAEKENNQ